MKYKLETIVTFFVIAIILFLRYINILQVDGNGFGKVIVLIPMILILSIFAIRVQRKIDINHENGDIHYGNLDILKYICSILILILHLRPFLNYSDQLDLTFNNIITRTCVPIFFVITGYFVAQKEKENADYIKLYIKKMIPLYLVWSLLYLPVIIGTAIMNFSVVEGYLSIFPFSYPLLVFLFILLLPIILLVALIYAGVYYHLWYFPAVMLSLWVLSKWKKKFNPKYLLILSFFFLLFGATETYYGVLPTTIRQLVTYYYNIFFTTRNFLFFGLFYVVMGYCMQSRKESYSKFCFEKLAISILFLIFEVILLQGTERLNSNILLSCIPLTYYLFVSSIYLPDTISRKWSHKLRDLSKYYYLIHPAIIFFFSFLFIDTDPFIQIVIILGFTHILTMLLLRLKRKKPHLFL